MNLTTVERQLCKPPVYSLLGQEEMIPRQRIPQGTCPDRGTQIKTKGSIHVEYFLGKSIQWN